MPKYIEADAIIEDLRYDIELDARTLDDLDFADAKERELIQLDKDIKQNAISILEHTPAADVRENVHGRWIKMSDADGVYWACSECGEDIPRIAHFDLQFDLFPRLESIDKTNFCPHCGAEMAREA